MYLDPSVRDVISSFQVSASEQEITNGLATLKADIASGKIQETIKQYESGCGDYLFVVGEKV